MVVFQLKHFFADYLLQFEFMLKGKALPGWGFLPSLAAHCAVHAGLTLLICLWIEPAFWWLALVDFGVHMAMDRVKSGPRYLGRYNDPQSASFWLALGFDQMVHHLTGIYIIWILIVR